MINELKKMLLEKMCKDKDVNLKEAILVNENNRGLVEQNDFLRQENAKLQGLLDVALDEITLNQQRINSILNQLRDKNGGK